MNILIKNARLISMDEERPQIEEDIDILIKDKEIKRIDRNIEEYVDKIVDAKGKVVMPGLINTHSHIPMSIFRETLDGYMLQEWLEEKIWPMEDKLRNKDIYYATLLSCIEMVRTGTTTINDMYSMADDIIKAAKEVGVRIQTTRTLMDLNDGTAETRLKELEELILKYKDDDIVTINIGIHGFYTTNNNYIKKCVELAKKYNLPIHIHFCENSTEIEDIKRIYNVESPVELIKRYFKGIHVILAHCVKLTDEEISELSKEDIYVSHCPVSNLKLGCGIAKVSEMLDKNICVSLGTDGQGSGSNLDLFETMKFTTLLQKGLNENPKTMPAYEILKMATINGAKALCLDDKIGSIKEGKKADIIILDMNTVLAKPENNIFAEIVYNVKGNNVETTIIDGNIIMENRKLKISNEEKIYKECESIIERIRQ